MERENIIQNVGRLYSERRDDINKALFELEYIAFMVRNEGILWIDERREELTDEVLPAKTFLLQAMEWVVDGTEQDILTTWMERAIDAQIDASEKGFMYIYITGMVCISSGDSNETYYRQRNLASLFGVEHYDNVLNNLGNYLDQIKEKWKKTKAVNIFKLHYNVTQKIVRNSRYPSEWLTLSELENMILNAKKGKEFLKSLCDKLSYESMCTLVIIADKEFKECLIQCIPDDVMGNMMVSMEYFKYLEYRKICEVVNDVYRRVMS